MDITLASPFLLLALVVGVSVLLTVSVADEVEGWRARRRARIEAELDRKQKELRKTILLIADALASDRNEASRQMTRAAFLATGQPPEPRQ